MQAAALLHPVERKAARARRFSLSRTARLPTPPPACPTAALHEKLREAEERQGIEPDPTLEAYITGLVQARWPELAAGGTMQPRLQQ